MTPRHLRAKARVTIEDMSTSLGLAPGEVRTLEETPVLGWDLEVLELYLHRLGYVLRLVASQDGREEHLD